MKTITAYRCEHCGKVYQRPLMCEKHEAACTKNPTVRPLCYSCKHYEFIPDKEKVEFSIDTPYGEISKEKDFFPHVCKKAEAPNNKLYFRIHLSEDWCEQLEEYHGYRAMATPTNGGCKNYEPQ